MTKEQAQQNLHLIQALAEGKTVQFRYTPIGNWIDGSDLNFSLPVDHYRIKPEPINQEFYYIIHKDSTPHIGAFMYAYKDLSAAREYFKNIDPKGVKYVIMHANASSMSDI